MSNEIVNNIKEKQKRVFKNGIHKSSLKWKADRPDKNDYVFKDAHKIDSSKWIPKTENVLKMPMVLDQGSLGSCTANSLEGHLRFVLGQQSPFSRLFIYYNERAMEGTIDSDAGAELRDGIKVLSKIGACLESNWDYDVTQFSVRPPVKCYTEAEANKIKSYHRIEDLDDMRQCLQNGKVFSFGFTCYSTFMSEKVATTGFLPMPGKKDDAEGGHAVCAVDMGVASDFLTPESIKLWEIKDNLPVFLVRNSWGPDWGLKGYFVMPQEYLDNDNLACDFWTIDA